MNSPPKASSLAIRAVVYGVMCGVFCTPVLSQGVDEKTLLKPPPDSWPGYHGDYSGKRHSSLTQITPQNVDELSLAWAFQTDQPAAIKSTPLVVDGIIYFTVPDNVWAVDARSGQQVWHYTYPPNKGFHIGQRGVAMYKDWLYFMTPDAHLVSLNAKDGTVRWSVVVADYTKGYWTTLAPLVVGNHVLVGVSGDLDNLRGFLRSIDPETGKTQWNWFSTPPPGTRDSTTGGMTWMTGTYDPALNLVFWGTGNPTPVLNASTRPGDNLYTCSIVALNPDTGKLVWAFQPSPHDTHDWDAVQTPGLFDGEWNGEHRKMLAQASRNGYFFVLDRQTGKNLVTAPFMMNNWSKGVDAQGRPIPNPSKEPKRDGTLVSPSSNGATNWFAPTYDPSKGLFYVNASQNYSVFYYTAEGKPEGYAGRDDFLTFSSVIEAIDYRTGKVKWRHDISSAGGMSFGGLLSTASGV